MMVRILAYFNLCALLATVLCPGICNVNIGGSSERRRAAPGKNSIIIL